MARNAIAVVQEKKPSETRVQMIACQIRRGVTVRLQRMTEERVRRSGLWQGATPYLHRNNRPPGRLFPIGMSSEGASCILKLPRYWLVLKPMHQHHSRSRILYYASTSKRSSSELWSWCRGMAVRQSMMLSWCSAAQSLRPLQRAWGVLQTCPRTHKMGNLEAQFVDWLHSPDASEEWARSRLNQRHANCWVRWRVVGGSWKRGAAAAAAVVASALAGDALPCTDQQFRSLLGLGSSIIRCLLPR